MHKLSSDTYTYFTTDTMRLEGVKTVTSYLRMNAHV